MNKKESYTEVSCYFYNIQGKPVRDKRITFQSGWQTTSMSENDKEIEPQKVIIIKVEGQKELILSLSYIRLILGKLAWEKTSRSVNGEDVLF